MTKRIRAYIYLLTTAVIWGIASVVIKHTLSFIKPFSFLFWRFLLTCLIMIPLLYAFRKKQLFSLSPFKIFKLFILGFIGTTLSLGLLFIGYQYTTAIDGVLIDSVAPILVIIGGAIFLKEKVTKIERLGAGLAFFGSITTIIQPFLEGRTLAYKNIYGNFLVFLSTFTWAVYCLLVRKIEAKDKIKTDPFVVTTITFISGLITIIPFFLWESLSLPVGLPALGGQAGIYPSIHLSINPSAIPGILFMVIFSSVIAYFTYNAGYALIEASEATIFDYLRPIFTAPLAVWWLKEQITISFLTGALLIALGVFLTEYKPKKIPNS